MLLSSRRGDLQPCGSYFYSILRSHRSPSHESAVESGTIGAVRVDDHGRLRPHLQPSMNTGYLGITELNVTTLASADGGWQTNTKGGSRARTFIYCNAPDDRSVGDEFLYPLVLSMETMVSSGIPGTEGSSSLYA